MLGIRSALRALFTSLYVIALSSISTVSFAQAPLKIILDGDVGPDPCDFATLSIAHNLHARGDIELLAIGGTLPDKNLVPTLDIYNKLAGSEIPLATYKNPDDGYFNVTVKLISNLLHVALPATARIAKEHQDLVEYGYDDVPSAVDLYRKVLSEQEDRSVTFLVLGQLYNIDALLSSEADQYSPLNGMELVEQKVDRFVMMIGAFNDSIKLADISFYNKNYFNRGANALGLATILGHVTSANGRGAEYNAMAFYPGLTQRTFEQLDVLSTPIVLLGNHPGRLVPTGDAYEKLPNDHPVRMAFSYNNPTSRFFEPNTTKNDPAYDELAVLYISQYKADYFLEESGHVVFSHNGSSTWTSGGSNRYTKITLSPNANQNDQLSDLIENMVFDDF